ncbi:MAG: DUF4912 domain-containing protein [Nostocaceae cyanobacterium]|nr:DUF4912 domain-containing protein [Nostocaceae cyanobacterium]
MRQQQKKDNSLVRLALLLTLAATPVAGVTATLEFVWAQSRDDTSSFSLPETVESGATVRIDASSSMGTINNSLKESFETKFPGAKIEIVGDEIEGGSEDSLQALLDGKVDLVAISRDLTLEEQAKGLKRVLLGREKIAIIVGAENPFKGGLTNQQFAQIFRGEITDWSEVGGSGGKIQFIDRPTSSEIRDAFRKYPVFKNGEFQTGSTAIQVPEDSVSRVVKQLGKDGIGYGLFHQVSKLKDVRVLEIDDALPDDAKYSFSQPLVYVYKENPTQAVEDFLGFATNEPGQEAIEAAKATEAEAIAQQVSPTATSTPSPRTGGNTNNLVRDQNNEGELPPWVWWLLAPFLGIGTLLGLFLGRRSGGQQQPEDSTNADNQTPVTDKNNPNNGTTTPVNEEEELDLEAPVSVVDNGGSNLTPGGGNGKEAEVTSNIVLAHRDSQWAYAQWELSPSDQQTQQQKGLQLVLRLYDVTDIDLSYQEPKLVQQYLCEQVAGDCLVPIPFSDRNYMLEIGYLTDDEGWLLLARSNIIRVFTSYEEIAQQQEEVTTEAAFGYKTSTVDTEPTIIILAAQDANSAHVEWELSPSAQDNMQQQQDLELVLRLYDVTDIDLSYQNPKLVKQYECQHTTGERLIPVPFSDHNYMVEIGYLNSEESWFLLARSNIIRVFSTYEATSHQAITSQQAVAATATAAVATAAVATTAAASFFAATHTDNKAEVPVESSIVLTPRTPKWAYAAWQVSDTRKQELRQQGGNQLLLRLYDVTDIDLSYESPKLVQQYECEETARDRFVAIPATERNYMLEIGYLSEDKHWLPLVRSPIVRVFNRPQSGYWFVADAELIIHGATEPNSQVTIGGSPIKVKPDGTFHLRVPFTEDVIDYVMVATAANGKDSVTIHKKFSNENP